MGKTICGKSRVLLGFIAAIGIIGAIVACGGEPAAEPDTAANRTNGPRVPIQFTPPTLHPGATSASGAMEEATPKPATQPRPQPPPELPAAIMPTAPREPAAAIMPTPPPEPTAASTPAAAVMIMPTPPPKPAPAPMPAGSPETDRAALVALYNATDGDNWTNNTNWLSATVPIGEWYGVTTDENGRVTVLNMHIKGLSGEIPPELGNLASLKKLELFTNQLSGEIPPELGNLASLEGLYLQDNQLSGCVPLTLLRKGIHVQAGLPDC